MRGHYQPLLTLALLAMGGFCRTVQAAAPDCATCHPKQSARFLASAMGKSLIPTENLSSAQITHERSHSVISIEYRNRRMVHRLSESGLTAEYPIRYQVGGGLIGSSFLVQIGDYLFE